MAAPDPGFRPLIESVEAEVLWYGRKSDDHSSTQPVIVDSTAVDAGNTPTTTLRGGLILAILTSDGNAYPYDPDAAGTGLENPVGVLEKTTDMLLDGVATDKKVNMLVTGRLKVAELLGSDANALAVLVARGFILDGVEPNAASLGKSFIKQQTKITDYTVVAADSGTLFVATTADANFTLPTIANGLYFEFLRLENFELVVTGSANIIGLNGVVFNTITVTTTAQQIGAYLRVEAMYVDGVLKWLPTFKSGPGYTVAYA